MVLGALVLRVQLVLVQFLAALVLHVHLVQFLLQLVLVVVHVTPTILLTHLSQHVLNVQLVKLLQLVLFVRHV